MAQPLALMGGAFDPVHHGHLIVARSIAEQKGYAKVVLVPSSAPPHKRPAQGDPADRLAMLRLAIEGDGLFEISTVELERSGPSYTIDTILALRQLHGADRPIHWIIGADMLEMLPTWRRAGELVELAQLVVAHRPPWTAGLENLFTKLEGAFTPEQIEGLRRHAVATPLIDISSTDIRRRVATGRPIRYLVPPAVQRYILDHGLYRQGQ